MKKKLLIGLLASLMMVSVAAACGETQTPDNSDTGSNVTTDSGNSDTGLEASKYALTLQNGDAQETSEVEAGATLELPTPTQEGRTFTGWVDSEGNAAPAVMPDAPLTLFATWEVTAYTVNVTLPDNLGTVSVKIGVEDVYSAENEQLIYVYTNGDAIEALLTEALCAYTSNTSVYEAEGLPYDADGKLVFSELKNYEFTAKAVDRIYTVYLPNDASQDYKYGDTLALPTPDAMDGVEFVKWVYSVYNEETGESQTLDAPATVTPDIDGITFEPVWNVLPYTLTIVNGNETKTYTFGVMLDSKNDINTTVDQLAEILQSELPTSTDTVEYSWYEVVPETFELQDYTFTVKSIQTVSIPDAIAIAEALESNKSTTDLYYVKGIIVKIHDTKYGHLTIADEQGNLLYVHGTYLGNDLYENLANKPQVGDYIKYRSVIKNNNGNAQLTNARIIEFSTPETKADIYKLAEELCNLTVVAKIAVAGDVTLPTAGVTYTDAVIAWTSSNADIAAVNGGTVTFTLPAEATTITLTATLTLGEATLSQSYAVEVDAAPKATEKTVTWNAGTQKGTKNANEEYVISEDLTISSHNNGCYFTTQLQIYQSATENGYVVCKYSGVVSKLTLNMGYKKATMAVYGSTDGETWQEIGQIVTTTTGFLDYELNVDATKGYTYIKLDAVGNQLRVKTIEAVINC